MFATYDKEINYDKLESNPSLYISGMKNKLFNRFIFWRWYIYATLAGLIIHLNLFKIELFAITENGQPFELWSMGSIAYTCIVLVVNVKIMITTNTHNIFSVILFSFSISSYFVVILVASYISTMNIFGLVQLLLKSKVFFLSIMLIVSSCIFVEYAWRSIQFFIEEYLLKQSSSSTPPSLKKDTIPNIECDTTKMREKGYDIKFNFSNEDSLNSNKEKYEQENGNITLKNPDEDQLSLMNRHKRCKLN